MRSILRYLLLSLLLSACAASPRIEAADAKPPGEQLLAAGSEQMAAAHWDEARPNLEKALASFRAAGDRRGEARALKELGNLYYSTDAPARAIEIERQGLAIARQLADKDLEARFLNNLGMALHATGKDDEAYDNLQQSVDTAHGLEGSKIVEAMALGNQADIDLARGNAIQALLELERAADFARGLGNPDLATRVLATLAQVYDTLGEPKKAAKSYEAAASYAAATGKRLGEANVLSGWALELLNAGQPEKSVEISQRVLAIAREQGSEETEAMAQEGLALAYDSLGDWAHEEEAAQQLLKIAASLKSESFRKASETHLQAARVHVALEREGGARLDVLDRLTFEEYLAGRPDAAAGYAKRQLATARKENNHLMAASALHHLAMMAQDQENLTQSIDLLSLCLDELAQVNGADHQRAGVLLMLGAARSRMGDSQGAFEAYKAMEKAGEKAQDREAVAIALQSQVSVLLLERNPKQAEDRARVEELLSRSLAIGRSLRNQVIEENTLAISGFVAFWEDDYRSAVKYWEQFVQVVRRPSTLALVNAQNRSSEVIALGLLARAYTNLGEAAHALELANASLTASRATQPGLDYALALDARAYVHLRAGRLAEAESDARAAIDLLEAERAKLESTDLAKAFALDQQSTLYDLLEQVLVQKGKPLEALQIAERGRAQAFLETLTGPGPQTASPESLASIARRHGAALVEYSILHDPMKVLLPRRIEGMQAEFENELLIWVVRPDGEVVLRSVDLTVKRAGGTGETLAARLDTLRKSIEAYGMGPDRQLLRDLYDELIAPIADLLPTNPDAPVVLVPQGALFLAPFPMLIDPAGHFLIERHTLLTAPSIAAVSRFQPPSLPAKWTAAEVLILGNPKHSPRAGDLPNLTTAAGEAREIAALRKVKPLLGDEATKAAVLRALPSARLVHFASHGLLEWGNRSELPGALALAPAGEADDGLLTADEIRTLKLSSPLVVLSACRTGQGRISGDGVIGLSRSFLTAGAAAVVMSLWRIPDDEGTASLMVDFHRRLMASGDPARSLRGAMLGAIQKGEDPSSWGSFLYVGAPAPKR